jgi:hypothetical protein
MTTTTTKIGPTFGYELMKHNLTGLPFSWGSDGSFNFSSSMTQSQINAVNSVYAAHNPVTSDLLGYSDDERKQMFFSGITVSGIATDVSPDAVSVMHQNVTYAQAHPSATFNVVAPDYTVTNYTATGLINLYNVVQGFVKSVYDMEATISAGILNGSITTYAQIDSMYATIPTSY